MNVEVETYLSRREPLLRGVLAQAAERLGLSIAGEPVFGWRMRSIGCPVRSDRGQYWLRVVAEYEEWAYGEPWTGNADANVITGVNKPKIVQTLEWKQPARLVRAEVMTILPGLRCSLTHELRGDPRLPAEWWQSLRLAADAVSATPTRRTRTTQVQVDRHVRAFFGPDVDTAVDEWTTAHGDFHWSNLTAPDLGILDWETWGTAPAGLDAASLYCFSLLHLPTADRVYDTFADLLDTRTGKTSQLYASVCLLRRFETGDFPELVAPLHQHARKLVR